MVFAGWRAGAERIPAVILLDPAFDHFYNLEYDQALAIFEAEAAATNSPDACNHVAQTLVFRAMFRAGVLETGIASTRSLLSAKVTMTPQDEKQFLHAIGRASELAQAQIRDHPDNTHAWYALGVARGLMGDYDLFVRKAYIDALKEMNSARDAHLHATALDPKFVDAQLTQGLYDYAVGSLPWGWRMLGFLGGFHGDRGRGIRTLENVAEHGMWNRVDAEILLSAIYRREKRPQQSIAVLQDLLPRMPRNYLIRMELAELYDEAGDHNHAFEIFTEIEKLKAEHAPGFDQLPEQKIVALGEKIGLRSAAKN